ncbi:MAG: hypothetical protein AB7I30_20625, partial [Isosphaeraceae bacterium]
MFGARSWGRRWVLGLVALAVLSGLEVAKGDRIVLRGGGTIPGKVVPDATDPERLTVILSRGKTPLRLQKSQVLDVLREPGPLDDYVTMRETVPATAEAQYELGLWCEKNKLRDLAELHFEAALTQDESFGPAHEKLGHREVNGVWLSGDELRAAQGLVKYKGKWVTAQERDLRER